MGCKALYLFSRSPLLLCRRCWSWMICPESSDRRMLYSEQTRDVQLTSKFTHSHVFLIMCCNLAYSLVSILSNTRTGAKRESRLMPSCLVLIIFDHFYFDAVRNAYVPPGQQLICLKNNGPSERSKKIRAGSTHTQAIVTVSPPSGWHRV